jgi:hypothetical protein
MKSRVFSKLVDSVVIVRPLAFDLDVSFISHPAGHCTAMSREGIRQETAVAHFLACAFVAINGAYFTIQRFRVE